MRKIIFIALLLVPGLCFAQNVFQFNAITGELDMVTNPTAISGAISDSLNTNRFPIENAPDTMIVKLKGSHRMAKQSRNAMQDSINTNRYPVENNPDTVIVKQRNGHHNAKAATTVGGTFGLFSAYGNGTGYTITTVANSNVTFSVTSPTFTLSAAGTYLLFVTGGVKAIGYSNTAVATITIKIRKTNAPASDIANAVYTITVPVATLITDHLSAIILPPVIYTTAVATDVLNVTASVDIAATAGSLQINQCSLLAVRVY